MNARVTRSGATPRRPKVAHPIDLANAKRPPELALSRYGKWRALSLLSVYLLMVIHILHWRVSGRTMAPLELSEIMKALELGVLSPGVIFIGAMLIGSLVFGRFFCSWGCHMLALQDLSHWILKKLRIRPRPIRSRVLLVVPVMAAIYMFIWPQIKRVMRGDALPEASARLTTTNFWRDLPGPLVIALTFLTCGFLIVYFFGGRGFCTYGCPYGVLFGLFDRLSPGRIRVSDGCKQCGRCTAICTSNVRVHEETKAYGMVVNPRCLKDLDCVSVCPENALHYRFGRPGAARPQRSVAPPVRYDFTISEEIALVVLFVAALLTWRGLYDRLPFLMSLAAAAVTAYLALTLARLAYHSEVKINRYHLKRRGRISRAGLAYMVACAAFLLFSTHSALIQLHRWRGDALVAAGDAAGVERSALLERAVSHYQWCDRYGLVSPTSLQMKLGTALLALGRSADAESQLCAVIERQPHYPEARIHLAEALADQGRIEEAANQLNYAIQIEPLHEEYAHQHARMRAKAHVQWARMLADTGHWLKAAQHYQAAAACDAGNADAQFRLGMAAALQGRIAEAVEHYRAAVAMNPDAPEAYANMGDALLALNRPDEAESSYRKALDIDPRIERVRFKLGVVALHRGRLENAVQHLEQAAALRPNDAETRNYFGLALEGVGRLDLAQEQYERAIAINDAFADAHFNLARLHASAGRRMVAEEHMKMATQIDPRYSASTPRPRDATATGRRVERGDD